MKKGVFGFIFLTLLIGLSRYSYSAESYYLIDLCVGEVTYSTADSDERLEALPGMEITAGFTVYTGSDSYCDIIIPDKGILRIDADSMLSLTELSTNRKKVKLGLGTPIANIVGNISAEETFEVETSTAVVGIRGTQFTVDVEEDQNSVVSVKEGTVKFRPNTDLSEIEDPEIVSNIQSGLEEEIGANQSVRIDMDELEDIRDQVLLKINEKVEDISEKIEDYKESGESKWYDFLGKMEGKIEDFMDKTDDMVGDIQENIEQKLSEFLENEDIQDMIAKIKRKIPLKIAKITGKAKSRLDEAFEDLSDTAVWDRISKLDNDSDD